MYNISSDGVWNLKPGSEWQAHKGPVWRLSWSHPEFGQLLATCGADHIVQIWEEQEGGFDNLGGAANEGSYPTSRWISKAQLTEARKSVNCVEFAPRHVGLRLATGSADGVVRIYDAIDVMNLNHWPLSQQIDCELDSNLGVTSLSWCNGRFENPMLVVGGGSRQITIWRFEDQSRQWHVAYQLPDHSRSVLDVSWAPNIGRGYHLIASSGKDGVLKMHRLKRVQKDHKDRSTKDSSSENNSNQNILEYESTTNLDTNGNDMWRLGWNATGTVLAASGDHGIVQLWKSDFNGEFKIIREA